MKEKSRGEKEKFNIEKNAYHEAYDKKDSLMWSEEDYDAMQKLTGFDDDSIEKDQKRTVSILILVVVCIICLILGIVIGYNVQPERKKKQLSKNELEFVVMPQAFYTKLNASNELFLYVLNNAGEEVSLLELSDSLYKYEFIDNYLYLLIEKNGSLKFYRYKFSKQGYRRDLIKEFDEEYTEFHFENGYVALNLKDSINLYDLGGVVVKSFDIKNASILSFNENYLIYQSDKQLNIVDSKLDSTKLITSDMDEFLIFDNDSVYFSENNKIYEVSTSNYEKIEVIDIKSVKSFMKVNNYYVFANDNALFILDNEIKKINEFKNSISELLYVDRDNLVIVLDNYDAHECSLKSDNYYLFNVNSKSIIERKISGCLNYKIINDYIKIG